MNKDGVLESLNDAYSIYAPPQSDAKTLEERKRMIEQAANDARKQLDPILLVFQKFLQAYGMRLKINTKRKALLKELKEKTKDNDEAAILMLRAHPQWIKQLDWCTRNEYRLYATLNKNEETITASISRAIELAHAYQSDPTANALVRKLFHTNMKRISADLTQISEIFRRYPPYWHYFKRRLDMQQTFITLIRQNRYEMPKGILYREYRIICEREDAEEQEFIRPLLQYQGNKESKKIMFTGIGQVLALGISTFLNKYNYTFLLKNSGIIFLAGACFSIFLAFDTLRTMYRDYTLIDRKPTFFSRVLRKIRHTETET